jgi:hypothetical protein
LNFQEIVPVVFCKKTVNLPGAMQAKDHKVLDRAAMIEAASRSLRQQMRVRDRPRSKGFHDTRDAKDPGALSEPLQQETSRRRIHSAENKYRMIASQREGAENVQSASSSALDSYPAEEEQGPTGTNVAGTQDVHPLGELKRPMSRKKVPSASAAAGLGACSNPIKMTDAFEQRKMRQPIPVESWGPRPPSRHRLPPHATLLDVSLLAAPVVDEERVEQKLITSGASRCRSEPGRESGSGRPDSKAGRDSVVSSTKWAAARYPGPLVGPHHSSQGLSDPRRSRKAKDWGSPEDLGIFGVSGVTGARSPNGQQLAKSLSGVFDHHSSEFRERISDRDMTRQSGSWAAHVDTAGALEVSGHSALGDHRSEVWMCSPGSGHLLPNRKSRHPEAVSVEDVEAEQDLRTNMFRKDAPPGVIVTRSSTQKKDRVDVRRGRDDRLSRGRNTPFSTSLDVDFLSLFAL